MTTGTREHPIAPHSAGTGAVLGAAADIALPANSRIVHVTVDGTGAYIIPTLSGVTTVTSTNGICITPKSGGAILNVQGYTHINAAAVSGTPNLQIVRLL